MTAILAIDVAKSSGWCLLDSDGRYVASGQVDCFGPEPRDICQRALCIDSKARLVLERPFGGNRATLVGLGAARGCWESAWRFATGRRTLVRVKSVYPQVWRSKLFGRSAAFALQERLTAQVLTRKTEVGADETAACSIASWARLPRAVCARGGTQP